MGAGWDTLPGLADPASRLLGVAGGGGQPCAGALLAGGLPGCPARMGCNPCAVSDPRRQGGAPEGHAPRGQDQHLLLVLEGPLLSLRGARWLLLLLLLLLLLVRCGGGRLGSPWRALLLLAAAARLLRLVRARLHALFLATRSHCKQQLRLGSQGPGCADVGWAGTCAVP